MQEIDELQVRTMEIDQAYRILTSLENVPESVLKQVRFGVNFQFDLYDYLYSGMQLKAKMGKAIGRGFSLSTTDLYTELENRNRIAKKEIIRQIGLSNYTTSRS